MAKIAIYDGYGVPGFGAHKRKRKRKSSKRSRGGARKQQNKMKACAAKWRRSSKHGSYRAFMRKCL